MKHFVVVFALLPNALCGMFRFASDDTFGGHLPVITTADPNVLYNVPLASDWSELYSQCTTALRTIPQKYPALCRTACRFFDRFRAEPKTLADLIKRAQYTQSLIGQPKSISEYHVCTLAAKCNFDYASIDAALSPAQAIKRLLFVQRDKNIRVQQQLAHMLLVERFFAERGYVAVYHGANTGYALFLELNKSLDKYLIGRSATELWCPLRAPGACQNFKNTVSKVQKHQLSDGTPESRKCLLAVGYAPTFGYRAPTEGPFWFWSQNTSISGDFDTRIIDLLQTYNVQNVPIKEIQSVLHDNLFKQMETVGICLQIFIHRSLVDQITYPALPGGSKKTGTVTQIIAALHQPYKMISTDALAYRAYLIDPTQLEQQARLILAPRFFATPNKKIKIIVWDFCTPEEKISIHKACDELKKKIKPQLDAQRAASKALTAERIIETLSLAWPG